jgi:hypothetical protein
MKNSTISWNELFSADTRRHTPMEALNVVLKHIQSLWQLGILYVYIYIYIYI